MTSRLQIQSQPPACHEDALAGLREILRVTRPDADVERIQRAYDVAASWHQGQTRRSGDPYITHPLAVATILAETGADDEMLCAAMLHDTIEVELEALAYATMKRNRHARSASGRLLLAVAALLPAAIRIRWCEEWLAELHTLPARRDRVRFAIHTASGIPQLAFTVRMPAWGHRRSG
jgi:hypothetical protein